MNNFFIANVCICVISQIFISITAAAIYKREKKKIDGCVYSPRRRFTCFLQTKTFAIKTRCFFHRGLTFKQSLFCNNKVRLKAIEFLPSLKETLFLLKNEQRNAIHDTSMMVRPFDGQYIYIYIYNEAPVSAWKAF